MKKVAEIRAKETSDLYDDGRENFVSELLRTVHHQLVRRRDGPASECCKECKTDAVVNPSGRNEEGAALFV